MASASPSAICAVVLAVGARFRGQASFSTPLSSTRSALRARVDCGWPVMPIKGAPMRRIKGSSVVSSSASPLLEIASTTSMGITMPRSPWLASAGCTNMAGVPVEASVAAILRPMWPLLPMPITTTRPLAFSTSDTARAKSSFSRRCRPWMAAASMSSVSRARRRAWAGSKLMA